MPTDTVTTLDLRELGCQQRHGLVFQCLGVMKPGQRIVIINDHDPEPLRQQIVAQFAERLEWSLEQRSPREFRASISLR